MPTVITNVWQIVVAQLNQSRIEVNHRCNYLLIDELKVIADPINWRKDNQQ